MPRKSAHRSSRKSTPPPQSLSTLSPAAQRAYKALAGRDDVTWKDLQQLGFNDALKIAQTWNELVCAGLAGGRISYAELGYVVRLELGDS